MPVIFNVLIAINFTWKKNSWFFVSINQNYKKKQMHEKNRCKKGIYCWILKSQQSCVNIRIWRLEKFQKLNRSRTMARVVAVASQLCQTFSRQRLDVWSQNLVQVVPAYELIDKYLSRYRKSITNFGNRAIHFKVCAVFFAVPAPYCCCLSVFATTKSRDKERRFLLSPKKELITANIPYVIIK